MKEVVTDIPHKRVTMTQGVTMTQRPLRTLFLVIAFVPALLMIVYLAYAITHPPDSRAVLPDPGEYNLFGENPSLRSIVPPEQITQTLDLNLSGARIAHLNIEDVPIGADGLTNAIYVHADSGQWIYTATTTFDNITCPSMTVSNSEIGTLFLLSNVADGNSFSLNVSTTTPDINLGSTRGESVIPTVTGSVYTHIDIDGGASGANIRRLTFSNIKARGGACLVDRLKTGALVIQNSTFGSGTGIDIADFVIATSTSIRTFTDTNNLEVPTDVR
jgi:hypothetical protein